MSAENLGIVFVLTLMRAPDSMGLKAVSNIQFQKEVIKCIIEEQDIIFER